MSYREKIMVFTCGVIIFITGFYFMLVVPAQEKRVRFERMIAHREKEIGELRQLQRKFLKQKKKFSSIEKRLSSLTGDFSSLTFLETVAQKSGVRDKITSINPQAPIDGGAYKGTTHEIKMADVSLHEIVEYLYRVENSEYWMKINRLVLKTRYGKPDRFDARFTVVSFSRA